MCPELPEAAQHAGPYPDVVPSEAVAGSLQKRSERIPELLEAQGGEGPVTACAQSCLRPAEASREVTVLPTDLGAGLAGLLDHAQSLGARQSCVKLEDSGSAHRSCRRQEHVAAADGEDMAPGAHPAGQGHGKGQPALCLDAVLASPDSGLKCRGAAPSPGSPGTPSSAPPASAGRTPLAQKAAVPPFSPGEGSPAARDAGCGSAGTARAPCPGGRSSRGPDSQAQALLSKQQQQQQKKRKKKKLTLAGAWLHGALSRFM